MNPNYVLGGDLTPVSGFYFPLFSMVFPSEIAISVESGGFLRKQNCCKLLQIYVHFVGGLYLIKSLIPFLSGPGYAVPSSWNRANPGASLAEARSRAVRSKCSGQPPSKIATISSRVRKSTSFQQCRGMYDGL